MTTGEPAFDNIQSATPDDQGWIELPLIVATSEVVFPETEAHINISEASNAEAARAAREQGHTLITALWNPSFDESPLIEQIYTIGTEIAVREARFNHQSVFAQGRRRVLIASIEQEKPYPIARARVVEQKTMSPVKSQKRVHVLHDLLQEWLAYNDMPETWHKILFATTDLGTLADRVAAMLPNLSPDERQNVLAASDVEARYSMVAAILRRQIGGYKLQEEIDDAADSAMARNQREAYLREQLRVIQSELGEDDGYQQELNELYSLIEESDLSEEAHDKAMREFKRLTMMNPMMPEAPVIRTYIDWLLAVPWSEMTEDNLDLKNAETILDEDHYGLSKVKDRIIEHIAVRKLAQDKQRNPIICFVGPPGVGKTSLGKSIARALDRQFVRISLGGVRDEAEIRGHRRTYIGALPGRIIQTMKRAGTINPVFMLDEIDKLAEDYRGDPASALLEVLDPEQNHEFSDHYLEVPYDLSNVMFIATANELYPLPEALEDRMEIIEFRGYTEEEKLQIARRYLIPKQLEAHGIAERGISFQNDALMTIIRQYTMEAGVRNLEREIANICRKITRLVATERPYPRRVTPKLVNKYLGPPYILETRVNRKDEIGLVTGLVWTPSGGDIQLIEVSLLPGKGNVTLTGQLGDVLQESAQAAISYIRTRATGMNIPHDDFENYDIHVHMPEGSVPKDGPSAGITLATAILSAFTEQRIRSDYAMTGEITLRGHVLPVGGIKEKVLAARRNRIKHVLLPKENEKDLVDVPKYALKDLEITFVETMQDVLDRVLHPPPDERQRDIEKAVREALEDEQEADED